MHPPLRRSIIVGLALVLLGTVPALADTPDPEPSETATAAPSAPAESPGESAEPQPDASASAEPSTTEAPGETPSVEPTAEPTESPAAQSPTPEPSQSPASEPSSTPDASASPSAAPSTSAPEQRQAATSPMDQYALANGLGTPVGSVINIGGGQVRYYQHGVVTQHPSHGMRFLAGAILDKVHALGGVGIMGFPTNNAAAYHGHQAQRFASGIELWSSARGTYFIGGAILHRYKTMDGFKRTQIGLLTCDDSAALGGRVSCFAAGDIYWSAGTGAWEVYGATRTAQLAVKSHLGLPTGPASALHGGVLQQFTQGQVVTYNGTTRAVYGTIYRAWQQVGGMAGSLGSPTTYEYRAGNGYLQKFTHGLVWFEPGVRTRVHYYAHPTVGVYRTTSAQVASTYRSGCPVGPSQLRTIQVDYWDYNGIPNRGEVVVRDSVSADVQYAFTQMWRNKFPVARMLNPNYFSGNDPAMMRNNNTSAFNCRRVVGNPYAMSPHSYGTAIDINPVQNPYRDPTGKWWPENGTAYILGATLNRTPLSKGMFNTSATPVTALESRGWFWGGRWASRDYHHFQK